MTSFDILLELRPSAGEAVVLALIQFTAWNISKLYITTAQTSSTINRGDMV